MASKAAPKDMVSTYMRGDSEPVAGSVPMSTSRYLNSPLFVHAFAQRSLRRYGHDVPTTYDVPDMLRGIADVTDRDEVQQAIDEEKAANPAFRAWIEARKVSRYYMDDLRDCAPGTLGHAILAFMTRSGLDINFLNEEREIVDDVDYLRMRSGGGHDIQHIVSGFGPDPAGEHALGMMNVTGNALAFNPVLARFASMPMFFITSAGYSRIYLNYPGGLPTILEATELGIRAGRSIRMPLLMVEWESYLDWQLDDVRADLGFEPGPGDGWEVSNETCLG
jgi:ubiquinone biosynthesis protein COQ4